MIFLQVFDATIIKESNEHATKVGLKYNGKPFILDKALLFKYFSVLVMRLAPQPEISDYWSISPGVVGNWFIRRSQCQDNCSPSHMQPFYIDTYLLAYSTTEHYHPRKALSDRKFARATKEPTPVTLPPFDTANAMR